MDAAPLASVARLAVRFLACACALAAAAHAQIVNPALVVTNPQFSWSMFPASGPSPPERMLFGLDQYVGDDGRNRVIVYGGCTSTRFPVLWFLCCGSSYRRRLCILNPIKRPCFLVDFKFATRIGAAYLSPPPPTFRYQSCFACPIAHVMP